MDPYDTEGGQINVRFREVRPLRRPSILRMLM